MMACRFSRAKSAALLSSCLVETAADQSVCVCVCVCVCVWKGGMGKKEYSVNKELVPQIYLGKHY